MPWVAGWSHEYWPDENRTAGSRTDIRLSGSIRTDPPALSNLYRKIQAVTNHRLCDFTWSLCKPGKHSHRKMPWGWRNHSLASSTLAIALTTPVGPEGFFSKMKLRRELTGAPSPCHPRKGRRTPPSALEEKFLQNFPFFKTRYLDDFKKKSSASRFF